MVLRRFGVVLSGEKRVNVHVMKGGPGESFMVRNPAKNKQQLKQSLACSFKAINHVKQSALY